MMVTRLLKLFVGVIVGVSGAVASETPHAEGPDWSHESAFLAKPFEGNEPFSERRVRGLRGVAPRARAWAAASNIHAAPSEAPDGEGPILSFGLVADIQYADGPSKGSRHYRGSLEKLREAIRVFNRNEVDRVMDLGDVIDRGPESFQPVMKVYKELTMPLSIAVGNHDFPRSRAHTLKALGMETSYFAFHDRNWQFIVLDGNDVSLSAREPGHPKYRRASRLVKRLKETGAPYAKPWNGAIGQEQLAWFKDRLSEAESQSRQVLIFCHFPLYPLGNHTLWNRNEVIETIKSHANVVAWFNGHHHAGSYVEEDGVHYLTLPAMVETSDQNAFAIVEVHDDSLKIHGYGRAKDRVLPTANAQSEDAP